MIKVKHIIYGLIMAAFFVPSVVKSQSNVIDEVNAVVGDNPILRSDIESQYQQAIMQGSSFDGDLKCHIFEQMLLQKLLLEQAKVDSIEVSENMVITQVDRQINDFINRAGSKEKLEEWLNKPLHQIKQDQREILRNQMLTQQMQSTITGDIKVTPAEIRAFFRKTASDSLPMVPAQFEVQQITVYPRVADEDTEAVKARLRDFQRQINEGRDFATLAVLYSEDTNSAARGGELGMMGRGELVPAFSQVAFNLQDKNKVSKIVETEFGFHIIQLIDRQGDRINVRHILMRPKPTTASFKEAQERIDSLAEAIRQEKISFEEAALRYSMDKDSRANGGIMVNPNDQSTKFEIQQIAPGVYRQIETIKIGQVSKSFLMKDERLGKDYYAIVKLTSRTEPHRANIKDDYQLLQSMLENQKSEATFSKWITKKQLDTYITISPNWINCEFEFKGWIK